MTLLGNALTDSTAQTAPAATQAGTSPDSVAKAAPFAGPPRAADRLYHDLPNNGNAGWSRSSAAKSWVRSPPQNPAHRLTCRWLPWRRAPNTTAMAGS
jgi:hypothetical protein